MPARRVIVAVALTLTPLGLGLAIGSSSADGGASSPPTLGPTSTREGVPVGYAHSAAGAARAAGEFVRAQGSPRWTAPAALRAGLAAMALPAEAGRLETIVRHAQAKRGDPLASALAAGRPATYVNVPLAYRLVAYRPDQARVALWLLDLSGTASSPPVEHYRTLDLRLVWRGDWRIAGMAGRPGPIPKGEGVYSTPASFMRALGAMRWFDAPAP